jgi:tRNA(Ile)-lysidine synthase
VSGIVASVEAALTEARVLRGDSVLAAVSGGPDSTCLLYSLAELREGLGITLCACFVDHGIRTSQEVEGELALVHDACGSLEVPLRVARAPRGECVTRARQEKRSLEDTARELRHRFLREAARDANAQVIALGHTQDDVLETLLMRLIQGSDVDGLAGVPLRRGLIVRPLLRCSRAQVREFLLSRNLPWKEDSSNNDIRFLRNRVRSLLLPVLEKDFPGYRTGMVMLARKLGNAAEVVRAAAARLAWLPVDDGFAIAAETFFGAPAAVRASSLLQLYDRLRRADSPRRLPWRFLSPALEARAWREGKTIRGYGVVLKAAGRRLFWGRDLASQGKKGYFIEVSGAGYITLPETGMRLTFVHRVESVGGGTGVVSLLAGEVQPPVFVRSKRMGDEILLDGGMTSVKDLLAGWKVPVGDRDKIPLLSDRKGVLAVLGSALGYRTRARAGALAEGPVSVDRIDVDIIEDMEEAREQQQR